jgi:hypothetical protein
MPEEMLPEVPDEDIRLLWRDTIAGLLIPEERGDEIIQRAKELDVPLLKALRPSKSGNSGETPWKMPRWFGSPEAVEALKEIILGERDAQIREALLYVFMYAARAGYRQAAEWLVERYPLEPRACLGPVVYGTLYGLSPAEGTRVILEWAQNEDKSLMRYNLTVLAQTHGAAVWPEIERAYGLAKDNRFRSLIWSECVASLWEPPINPGVHWQRTHPQLLQFLLDNAYGRLPDSRRSVATRELALLFDDDEQARAVTIQFLKDADEQVRETAYRNAGTMKLKEALPALLEVVVGYRDWPDQGTTANVALGAIRQIDRGMYDSLTRNWSR